MELITLFIGPSLLLSFPPTSLARLTHRSPVNVEKKTGAEPLHMETSHFHIFHPYKHVNVLNTCCNCTFAFLCYFFIIIGFLVFMMHCGGDNMSRPFL